MVERRTGQPDFATQLSNHVDESRPYPYRVIQARSFLVGAPSQEDFFGGLREMYRRIPQYSQDWNEIAQTYEQWQTGYIDRRKRQYARNILEGMGKNPEQPLPEGCLIVETTAPNPQIAYPVGTHDVLIHDLQRYLYPSEQFKGGTDSLTSGFKYLETSITKWVETTQTNEPYQNMRRGGVVLTKTKNGDILLHGRSGLFDAEDFAFFSGHEDKLTYSSMDIRYIASPPNVRWNDTPRATVNVPVEAVVSDVYDNLPLVGSEADSIKEPVGFLMGRALKQSLRDTLVAHTGNFQLTALQSNGSVFLRDDGSSWYRRCVVTDEKIVLPDLTFRVSGTSPEVQEGMRYFRALSHIQTASDIEQSQGVYKRGTNWIAVVAA